MRTSVLTAMLALVAFSGATDIAFTQTAAARIWKDTSGKFEVRAVLIEQTATAVKVSPPVLANRGDGVFLLSIGRNKSGSPQETRGRIYTVNLAQKLSALVWDQPNAVQVLGHDQASDRTLIVDKLDQFQRGVQDAVKRYEKPDAGHVEQFFQLRGHTFRAWQ